MIRFCSVRGQRVIVLTRTSPSGRKLIGIAVLSAILMSSCTSETVLVFAGSRPGRADPKAESFQVASGRVNGPVSGTPWHTATLAKSRTQATIYFSAGPVECWVLDRIDVKYRKRTAIVTLIAGTTASEGAGTICNLRATSAKVGVEFDRPVQEIRDGSESTRR